jgi:hypothetical protein
MAAPPAPPASPKKITYEPIDVGNALSALEVMNAKILQPLIMLPQILATVAEASHWYEASKQDRERAAKDLETAQAATKIAKERQHAAELAQAAAENAAKAARAEAKRTEDETANRIKAAQDHQGARLAELDAEATKRQIEHDVRHTARLKTMDTEIGVKQAELADIVGKIEALRSGLPALRPA